MAVATLSIDLEARLARLEGDLTRATATIDRQAQRMRKSFDSVGESTKTIFAGLGATAAVTALQTYFKSAVDGVDKLNDLKDATGASIENLSALEDIGARTGTSIDTVGDAVGKLNKVLSEAEPDSKQARLLQAIGLSAEELKKLDPAEALRRVAVALAGYADDGKKARLVQDLLGKSYKEAAPFLKDLAAAGELNAKVTAKQAEEAERFNQLLFQMQKNSTDTARALAGELLPALNEGLVRFLKLREAFGGTGAGLLTLGKEVFISGNQFRNAGDGVAFYAGKVKELQDKLADPKNQKRSLYGTADPEALRAELEKAKQLESYYRKVYALTAASNGQNDPRELARRGRLQALASVPDVPDKASKAEGVDKAAEAYRRLAEKVGQATAAAEEEMLTGEKLSPLLKLRLEILQDLTSGQLASNESLKNGALAQADYLLELDARLKAEKELLRAVEERANFKNRDYQAGNDAAAANEAAMRDRLRNLLADTPTGNLEAVTADIRFLNEQFAAGKIEDVDRWAEAVRAATGKLKPAKDATDELGKTAESLGLTFASAFEDAIVGGKKFSEVLQGLEQDIIRILARKLITEPAANFLGEQIKGLGGGGSGGSGGLASLLSSLFGSANGNAFGPGGLIPFANGGIVDRPTMFGFGAGRMGVMGEAGAEGVLPLKRGRNGKLGVIAQGGGGTVQNISVTVAGVPGQSREDAMQQGVLVGRGIQRALARNG